MNIVRLVKSKVFLLMACIMFFVFSSKAQLKLSAVSAINALNNNTVAVAPPVPVSSSAIITPVINSPSVSPGPTNNASGIIADMQSARDVNFLYQSAFSWWQGYTDYKNAAASVSFSPDGNSVQLGGSGIYIPVPGETKNAVNFFLEDTHFVLFRDYSNKKVTMMVRGNQPVPVELVADNGGYITYTPQLTPLNTSLPLNLK